MPSRDAPLARGPPGAHLRWWTPRIILVVVVSLLPVLLLLPVLVGNG